MSPERTSVAVLGLGEAGGLISVDLVASGLGVRGFDPAQVATPVGVVRCGEPCEAVDGVKVVLAITATVDATVALAQVLPHVGPDTVYADLSSGSPELKRHLAATAGVAGLAFVDVALMGAVPGKGLRTPALASGPGATRLVEILRPLGMPIEEVGPEPGLAATRKLLRSVTVKGLAALIIESVQAARAAGVVDQTWRDIVEQVASIDAAFVRRLVEGTERHAVRRRHEMEAAAALLADLGIEPVMTRATVETLHRAVDGFVPELPLQP